MSEPGLAERRLGHLQAFFVGVLCFTVVFVFSSMGCLLWLAIRSGQSTAEIRNVATETHSSLCALKKDLQVRHKAGEEFLLEHPQGIPGITAEQISQSLDNQQSTLDALAALDC